MNDNEKLTLSTLCKTNDSCEIIGKEII
jgi:hypothetical protein